MEEAYVRLLCPECRKEWESSPSELPAAETDFACPDCGESRPLSEFLRTEQDLQTLQELR
jgi:predicted RNA-binding Zn-ribbon protein involved in translation (DUF1610 family)